MEVYFLPFMNPALAGLDIPSLPYRQVGHRCESARSRRGPIGSYALGVEQLADPPEEPRFGPAARPRSEQRGPGEGRHQVGRPLVSFADRPSERARPGRRSPAERTHSTLARRAYGDQLEGWVPDEAEHVTIGGRAEDGLSTREVLPNDLPSPSHRVT